MQKQQKQKRYERRKMRVKSGMFGTESRPRLTVFRSNQHIYAQIVDDTKNKTVVSASDAKKGASGKITKTESASAIGEELAKKAIAAKIKAVVFDRNGFKYHGRVKALADGARKGGLEF
jgi:large subunit ribosomal protein L18